MGIKIKKKKKTTDVRTLLIGAGALAGAAGGVVLALSRKARGRAKGAFASSPGTYDDVTLARKVESEIFRGAEAPKGDVLVNAEHGVVFLRGQVQTDEEIKSLEQATLAVDGVKGVETLLHTPGTPAPMKG